MPVNDGSSHTVNIDRNERTATLVIDDTYVARATSPGESTTLDIESDRLYLGATVDSDGKSSNGYTGCITGAKLNHKDLPVSGSTKDYTAKPSAGVESGCNFEPPQGGAFPTVVTIAAGGVGLLLLIVIAISFVLADDISIGEEEKSTVLMVGSHLHEAQPSTGSPYTGRQTQETADSS